jgi:hypothetical protein
MDSMVDKRTLSIPEFNFRQLVKIHLEELLLAECNYWRKRCTIRWVKLGEHNTKFFHAKATERFRRNFISSLVAPDVGKSVIMIKWLVCYGLVTRKGWGLHMVYLCSLILLILNRVDGLEILSRPFEE